MKGRRRPHTHTHKAGGCSRLHAALFAPSGDFHSVANTFKFEWRSGQQSRDQGEFAEIFCVPVWNEFSAFCPHRMFLPRGHADTASLKGELLIPEHKIFTHAHFFLSLSLSFTPTSSVWVRRLVISASLGTGDINWMCLRRGSLCRAKGRRNETPRTDATRPCPGLWFLRGRRRRCRETSVKCGAGDSHSASCRRCVTVSFVLSAKRHLRLKNRNGGRRKRKNNDVRKMKHEFLSSRLSNCRTLYYRPENEFLVARSTLACCRLPINDANPGFHRRPRRRFIGSRPGGCRGRRGAVNSLSQSGWSESSARGGVAPTDSVHQAMVHRGQKGMNAHGGCCA